jgi:AcrR family transcriptional regulator
VTVDREDARRRLIAAAERIVSERGASVVSEEVVSDLAGVPREVFEEAFADRDDCLLAVFDDVAGDLRTSMLAAHRQAGSWVDGVRAALGAILVFLDEDPRRARFMVVEALAGDPPMRRRRDRLVAEMAQELESRRPPTTDGASDEHSHAEAVVGAVAAVIHARLLEEPPPKLSSLAGTLMSVLVLPYLGTIAARDEMERSTVTAG